MRIWAVVITILIFPGFLTMQVWGQKIKNVSLTKETKQIISLVSEKYGVNHKNVDKLKAISTPNNATNVLQLAAVDLKKLPNNLFRQDQQNNMGHKYHMINDILSRFEEIYSNSVSANLYLQICNDLVNLGDEYNQDYIHTLLVNYWRLEEVPKNTREESIFRFIKKSIEALHEPKVRRLLGLSYFGISKEKTLELLDELIMQSNSTKFKNNLIKIKESFLNPPNLGEGKF